jgi:hypothetical protein
MDGVTEIVFGVAGVIGAPMLTEPTFLAGGTGAGVGVTGGALGSCLGGMAIGSLVLGGLAIGPVTGPQPPLAHELHPPSQHELPLAND